MSKSELIRWLMQEPSYYIGRAVCTFYFDRGDKVVAIDYFSSDGVEIHYLNGNQSKSSRLVTEELLNELFQ